MILCRIDNVCISRHGKGAGQIDGRTDPAWLQYGASIMTLTSGFLVMLGVIYGLSFLSGSLVTAFDPQSTVIELQLVPVLAAEATIATFSW